MGEYAIRKSDGTEVKIGTCESMYYLRHSDRDKMKPTNNSLDPNDDSILKVLNWRLPFPDEDQVLPGDYDEYDRGVMLFNFTDPTTATNAGIVQVKTPTGMLVNIACYHGEKLPENTKDVQFHWNGKGHFYKLKALKFIDGVMCGIVSCVDCRTSWRYPLKELIPFIVLSPDGAGLKDRLIEWYIKDGVQQ